MRCRLCERWWGRRWERADAWEQTHSNAAELWAAETPANRALAEEAYRLHDTDPAASFRLSLDAAEAGSPWAMETAGWHYWTGTVVAADFDKAQAHYRRAIEAGSWMATISYARLLAEHGYHEEAERLLEDGVAADFVPAYFCLAWLRKERCKSRETLREIRPLLEYAAAKGHPVARPVLVCMLIKGKFGIRGIPRGVRLLWRWTGEECREDPDGPSSPKRANSPACAAGDN